MRVRLALDLKRLQIYSAQRERLAIQCCAARPRIANVGRIRLEMERAEFEQKFPIFPLGSQVGPQVQEAKAQARQEPP